MSNKIPMRSCVITKEKLPKSELIRVVRTTNGEVIIDLKGKVNGRGAYIKKDIKIIQQAQANKVLERHLEATISDDLYEQLVKSVK
jgi:hypothetical protein